MLYFDCPETVMEARLLGRNEGRTDDNIETIKKRFQACAVPLPCSTAERVQLFVRLFMARTLTHCQAKDAFRVQVFLQSSLPVIQHYEAKGKVHRIYADRSPDEVYQEVRKLFL